MNKKSENNPETLTYIDTGELQEHKRSIRKAMTYLPDCISALKSYGFPEEEIHTIENEKCLVWMIAKHKIKTPKEKCLTFLSQLWHYWDLPCLYFTNDSMSVIDEEKSLSLAQELSTHVIDKKQFDDGLKALVTLWFALKEVEKAGLKDFILKPFGLYYRDDEGVTRTYGIEDLFSDTKEQLTEKGLLILRDWCKIKNNK